MKKKPVKNRSYNSTVSVWGDEEHFIQLNFKDNNNRQRRMKADLAFNMYREKNLHVTRKFAGICMKHLSDALVLRCAGQYEIRRLPGDHTFFESAGTRNVASKEFDPHVNLSEKYKNPGPFLRLAAYAMRQRSVLDAHPGEPDWGVFEFERRSRKLGINARGFLNSDYVLFGYFGPPEVDRSDRFYYNNLGAHQPWRLDTRHPHYRSNTRGIFWNYPLHPLQLRNRRAPEMENCMLEENLPEMHSMQIAVNFWNWYLWDLYVYRTFPANYAAVSSEKIVGRGYYGHHFLNSEKRLVSAAERAICHFHGAAAANVKPLDSWLAEHRNRPWYMHKGIVPFGILEPYVNLGIRTVNRVGNGESVLDVMNLRRICRSYRTELPSLYRKNGKPIRRFTPAMPSLEVLRQKVRDLGRYGFCDRPLLEYKENPLPTYPEQQTLGMRYNCKTFKPELFRTYTNETVQLTRGSFREQFLLCACHLIEKAQERYGIVQSKIRKRICPYSKEKLNSAYEHFGMKCTGKKGFMETMYRNIDAGNTVGRKAANQIVGTTSLRLRREYDFVLSVASNRPDAQMQRRDSVSAIEKTEQKEKPEYSSSDEGYGAHWGKSPEFRKRLKLKKLRKKKRKKKPEWTLFGDRLPTVDMEDRGWPDPNHIPVSRFQRFKDETKNENDSDTSTSASVISDLNSDTEQKAKESLEFMKRNSQYNKSRAEKPLPSPSPPPPPRPQKPLKGKMKPVPTAPAPIITDDEAKALKERLAAYDDVEYDTEEDSSAAEQKQEVANDDQHETAGNKNKNADESNNETPGSFIPQTDATNRRKGLVKLRTKLLSLCELIRHLQDTGSSDVKISGLHSLVTKRFSGFMETPSEFVRDYWPEDVDAKSQVYREGLFDPPANPDLYPNPEEWVPPVLQRLPAEKNSLNNRRMSDLMRRKKVNDMKKKGNGNKKKKDK